MTEHYKRLIPVLLALVFSVFTIAPSFAQAPVSICVLKDRNQGGTTVTDCVPVGSGSGYVGLPTTSGGSTGGQTGSISALTTVAPTAGAFSSILASNASRKSCTIQNVGTTLGYVYPGANGSATTGNAFQVAASGVFLCTNSTITITDNISATCASGTCAFVISTQ